MRIRIDDNFDNDTEIEYTRVDDESLLGNGKLSNLKQEIVDVNLTDIEEAKYKNEEITFEVKNKDKENNKVNIDLQNASINNEINTKEYNNYDGLRGKEKNKGIVDNNKKNEVKNSKTYYNDKKIKGKITVYSRMGDVNGTLISDARINLYELNGISPKLVESKLTNKDGFVVFEELPEGSYRIIGIVNRKYFEKPTYIHWNEVTINKELNEESITIINRIKKIN